MAYSKQTWDTTSYVNPTRMNHIEDGIYNNSIITESITITTNASGIYVSNVPIAKFLFAYTQSGVNYYVLARQSSSFLCVFFVVDGTFNPVANESLTINIVRLP